MSCRSSAGNSAVTSLARMQSGLSDMQTLSTFHALIREGQILNFEPPSLEAVSEWLAQTCEAINTSTNLSQERKASLLARLSQVAGQPPPNAATFYAWQELPARTSQLASNLARWQQSFFEATYDQEYLANISPEDYAELLARQRQKFNQLRRASDNDRSLVADAEWASWQASFMQTVREDAYIDQPQLAELARRAQELPIDRGTQYALWRTTDELMEATYLEDLPDNLPTHCQVCGQFLPIPPYPHLCPGSAEELLRAFPNLARTSQAQPELNQGAVPEEVISTELVREPALISVGAISTSLQELASNTTEASSAVQTEVGSVLVAFQIQEQEPATNNAVPLSTLAPAPRLATLGGERIYGQWVAELSAQRASALAHAASQSDTPVPFSERGGPPYETENVLGAAATTFGVELEFRAANTDAIAQKLYDMGLAGHPTMMPYHHSCADCEGYWKVERDGSVTEVIDGQNIGGEVVAPVLSDTRADWEALAKVSQVLVEEGAVVDANTGQHVHVGTASYGISGTSYRNLAALLAANEDLVYRLAAPEVEYHRGLVRTDHAAYHYARPLADRLEETLVQSATPTLADVLRAGGVFEAVPNRRRVPLAHYIGLNLQHVNPTSPENSRVEFRHFNGTLDPAQIQTNVRLAAAMAYAANQPDFEVEEQARWHTLGTHRGASYPNNASENIREFLDRLKLSENGAKAILDTFLRGNWQPTRRPSSARIEQALTTYRAVR